MYQVRTWYSATQVADINSRPRVAFYTTEHTLLGVFCGGKALLGLCYAVSPANPTSWWTLHMSGVTCVFTGFLSWRNLPSESNTPRSANMLACWIFSVTIRSLAYAGFPARIRPRKRERNDCCIDLLLEEILVLRAPDDSINLFRAGEMVSRFLFLLCCSTLRTYDLYGLFLLPWSRSFRVDVHMICMICMICMIYLMLPGGSRITCKI